MTLNPNAFGPSADFAPAQPPASVAAAEASARPSIYRHLHKRTRFLGLLFLSILVPYSSGSAAEFRIGDYRAIALMGEPRLLTGVQYVSFAGDYGFIPPLPGAAAIEGHVRQESALLANFQLRVINLEFLLPGNSGLDKDRQTDAVALDVLKRSGYHVVSRANNHAMDFGYAGVHHNTRLLGEAGFKMIGLRTSSVYNWEIDGHAIALFSLADDTDRPDAEGLVLGIDDADLRLIGEHSSNADFRIAFVHLGSLGFYPSPHERTQVKRILHAGADLVVCTGSHFVKGFLYEDGKPVFYGIGNHIFSGSGDTEPVGIYAVAGLKDGKLVQLFVVPFHNAVFGEKTYALDESEFATFQRTFLDRSAADPGKYYSDPSSLAKMRDQLSRFDFTKVGEIRGRHVVYALGILYHHYPVIVIGSGLLVLASAGLLGRWIVRRHRRRKAKRTP